MDTRRIELLLTVQAMLLALVVHVLVVTTGYFGRSVDWFVTLFPVFVSLYGSLFLGHRGYEYATVLLASSRRGEPRTSE